MKQRPSISRRQGEAFRDDEKSMEEILGLSRQQESRGGNKLAAQVNAVAVLDMTKSLQGEIKVHMEFENKPLYCIHSCRASMRRLRMRT